jgi:hypothetical protein
MSCQRQTGLPYRLQVFLYSPTAYIIHTVQAITFLLNTQLSLMVDVTHLSVIWKSLHARQKTFSVL